MLAGTVGYVLASALCTTAPSADLLILARPAQGTAGGAAIVIARAVVRDRYQDAAAARRFSTLMQISGLAPVLAPLAGGLPLKVTSWRGLFAAITALGARGRLRRGGSCMSVSKGWRVFRGGSSRARDAYQSSRP